MTHPFQNLRDTLEIPKHADAEYAKKSEDGGYRRVILVVRSIFMFFWNSRNQFHISEWRSWEGNVGQLLGFWSEVCLQSL